MDGIESEDSLDIESVDLNECEFVELKVKILQTEKQKRNFLRFALKEWWCQCFLANIKKIIVGLRNENGIVRELSTFYVSDIPNQAKVRKYHFITDISV